MLDVIPADNFQYQSFVDTDNLLGDIKDEMSKLPMIYCIVTVVIINLSIQRLPLVKFVSGYSSLVEIKNEHKTDRRLSRISPFISVVGIYRAAK